MLPKIWIIDSYSLMMIIGIIGAFTLFYLYNKNRTSIKYILDILIVACIAIGFGLVGAIFFQWIFDLLKGDSNPELSMTFYVGLVFGVISFLIIYKLFIFKKHPKANIIKNVYVIAPASITIAHGIGRIGCFLAGCCYGIETNSIFGVVFPGMTNPVYPTQLFEASFLITLSIILFFIAHKKESTITMPIYLISYGIFRFLIEFIRGDDRGGTILLMSPAQFISVFITITGIVLFFAINDNKMYISYRNKIKK